MIALETLIRDAELLAAAVECTDARIPEAVIAERLDFPLQTIQWARQEALAYRVLLFKVSWARRRARIQRG